MTSLAPAGEHHPALIALLTQAEEEGAMCIDAIRESSYVRRERPRRGSEPGGRQRWAILDEHGAVVGYLSGRFKGGIPNRHPPSGVVEAFITMVIVAESSRGAGHGWLAVRAFAKAARDRASASVVGLRLDECGDIERRRSRFRRMGFEFEDDIGHVRVDALLAEGGPE